MEHILPVYKPLGMTPLECVRILQEKYPEYHNVKIGYAGRLDPMAEGVLLLLLGEENKKRKEYERLSKHYIFEVLFGIATDSYDILGIPTINTSPCTFSSIEKNLLPLIPTYTGKMNQTYPPYSSPRVNGKPLFYWARNGKLKEITIPTKEITIHSFQYVESNMINMRNLQLLVHQRISRIEGEFRQTPILEAWHDLLEKYGEYSFPIFRFHIECSSGTYIRSIAHELGVKLQIGAIALQIIRTKVGNFSEKECLNI